MPLVRPLCIAVGVTALVALLSYALPSDWQSTGVGLCLLGATYFLVLSRDAVAIRQHGLSLGGVFEPVPLDARRLAKALAVALFWSACAALAFFPPFWAGFVLWWQPARAFQWPPFPPLGALLTQLLGIAVPEEMFYRGYVQTALDGAYENKANQNKAHHHNAHHNEAHADAHDSRLSVLGAKVGMGLLLGSAIFALGHFATSANPARLSVFFPSLVFGWLRARTGGIGSAVLFHAACNVFSAYLTDGYFPN